MPSGSNSFTQAGLNSFLKRRTRQEPSRREMDGFCWSARLWSTVFPPPPAVLPAVPWLRGTPGCVPQQRAPSPRGLGLGAGPPALPAQGLLGKTHPRVGAGGRNRWLYFLQRWFAVCASLNNASFWARISRLRGRAGAACRAGWRCANPRLLLPRQELVPLPGTTPSRALRGRASHPARRGLGSAADRQGLQLPERQTLPPGHVADVHCALLFITVHSVDRPSQAWHV